MTQEKNGWGKPMGTLSRKFHYFVGFRSLCGSYGWLGKRDDLEDDRDDHPENCATCRKRVAPRRAREVAR